MDVPHSLAEQTSVANGLRQRQSGSACGASSRLPHTRRAVGDTVTGPSARTHGRLFTARRPAKGQLAKGGRMTRSERDEANERAREDLEERGIPATDDYLEQQREENRREDESRNSRDED
jgi:hypothetical protein